MALSEKERQIMEAQVDEEAEAEEEEIDQRPIILMNPDLFDDIYDIDDEQ